MTTQKLLVSASIIGLLALAGCGEDGGTDIGEVADCDQQRTALGFDEASDFGFSADELLDEIQVSGEVNLDWSDDGGSTDLNWNFATDQEEIYFVEEVPAEGEERDGVCSDSSVSVGGTLDMNTEDEKLQETIETELTADSATAAEISESLPLEQLEGSLEVDDPGPEDLIRIDGDLTEAGYSGTLAHDPYSEDDDSVTDEAWNLLAEW